MYNYALCTESQRERVPIEWNRKCNCNKRGEKNIAYLSLSHSTSFLFLIHRTVNTHSTGFFSHWMNEDFEIGVEWARKATNNKNSERNGIMRCFLGIECECATKIAMYVVCTKLNFLILNGTIVSYVPRHSQLRFFNRTKQMGTEKTSAHIRRRACDC